MSEAIVVDTMIASAWLGKRQSQRRARWAPLLESSVWMLPFVVVAEMRFGAEVAAWGARRRGALDRLVDRAGVVPPLREERQIESRFEFVQLGFVFVRSKIQFASAPSSSWV